MVSVLPIVFVTDLEASIAFYGALGLAPDTRSRSGKWVELRGSDSRLALHRASAPLAPATQRVQLNFEAAASLEEIATSLSQLGVAPATEIADEMWGRSVAFVDPDGLRVEIHEHDRSLYTEETT